VPFFLLWTAGADAHAATLYELRSATAAAKKRQLLVEVAKWSGDGLRTACLKMPAS
jgi:trafficking protein particle complex subunit 12